MSPASYLAAPPRVAASSVAPADYDRPRGLGDLRGADRGTDRAGRGRRIPCRPGAPGLADVQAVPAPAGPQRCRPRDARRAHRRDRRADLRPERHRAEPRTAARVAGAPQRPARNHRRRPGRAQPLHGRLPAQIAQLAPATTQTPTSASATPPRCTREIRSDNTTCAASSVTTGYSEPRIPTTAR